MPVNEADYQKPAILDRLQNALQVYQNQGVASGVEAAQEAIDDVNAAQTDADAFQVELDFRAGEYGPVPDIDDEDPALPPDPDQPADPDPDPIPDPNPQPDPQPMPDPQPVDPDPVDPDPGGEGDPGGDGGDGGDGGGGGD